MPHRPLPRELDADPVDIVSRYGWLAACPPWFREWALSRISWVRGNPGDLIMQGGSGTGDMWCAAAGQIAYVSAVGQPTVAASFFGHSGFWWGQGSVFRIPQRVSAVARTAYVVGRLPLNDIRAFLEREPRAWEFFGHAIIDIQMVSAGAYEDQQLPDSRRRLAAAILRLSGRTHRRYPVIPADRIWCTQDELAMAATLSRNTTGAQLRTLEADGLVRAAYGTLGILDAAGLEALVSSRR